MRISFRTVSLSIAGLGVIACAKSDAGRDKQGDRNTDAKASTQVSAAIDTSPLAPRSGRSATIVNGPSLVVDSSIRSPRLETMSSELVVRIPRQMAKLLFDSLPGFRPFARGDYLERVKTAMDSAGAISPLSTAIGDFDGDSAPDLAMIGSSRDSISIVMLVSGGKRGSGGASGVEPRLFLLIRPFASSIHEPQVSYLLTKHPGKVSGDFTLKSDGVNVVSFEKASSIYYLDNGKLRQFEDSED